MTAATIVTMLQNGRADLSWFDANLVMLRKEYDGQFIAFCNKEVIASDPSLDGLMSKLGKKNVDTSNVLVKFVSKVKAIL